ncbi:TetR family transcriptional regulator [bacterium]|nr:TetR family transcriptional regulator [bacterium]
MTNKDTNTEEKIKEAARKLFLQKGYANTKTRDIAAEAGINLALLNYYFRSKEKLFALIMKEHMMSFLSGLQHILNQELDFDKQIQLFADSYIDMLLVNPDLPIFILSELRNHPDKFLEETQLRERVHEVRFFKELIARTDSKVHPLHFFINLISITVFPFVGRPLIQGISGISDQQFTQMMQERKELIPKWIELILSNS